MKADAANAHEGGVRLGVGDERPPAGVFAVDDDFRGRGAQGRGAVTDVDRADDRRTTGQHDVVRGVAAERRRALRQPMEAHDVEPALLAAQPVLSPQPRSLDLVDVGGPGDGRHEPEA